MTDEKLGYLPGLDGVRALAVLAVLLYHGDVSWMPGGFLGVDVFFVLSGYLITSLLLVEHDASGAISLRAFWARRARRLLPALFVMLLLVSAYAAIVAGSAELGAIRTDAFATLFYVANWRLVFQHASYFQNFTAPSPLKHTWSLAIEEQWYLVWPLVVAFVLARARRGRNALLTLAVTATVVSALAMALLYRAGRDPSRVYYGADTRAQALLIGAILAMVLPALMRRAGAGRVAHGVGWAGLLVLVAMFTQVHGTNQLLYHGGFTVAALASAAVVAGAVGAETPFVALFSLPPLRKIGRISYGLYLFHWPIYVWMSYPHVHVTGAGLLAMRIAATFAVALVSYFVVESPVRFAHRSSRRLVRPSRAIPALALVAAAAVLASTVGATASPFGPAPVLRRSALHPGAPRVLIVGDSTAVVLFAYFPSGPVFQQLDLSGAAEFGCAVEFTDVIENGIQVPMQSHCRSLRQVWAAKVKKFDPDLVFVMSGAKEVLDQVVHGRVLHSGTEPFANKLARSLHEDIGIFGAYGARTLIADVPCFGSANLVQERHDPRRAAAVNKVIEQVASESKRVSVLPMSQFLCPGGTYREKVDGVVVRPDGVHTNKTGAPVFWKWLSPRLIAAARTAQQQRRAEAQAARGQRP